MTTALPWFALDAQDWLNGTKRLSAASQGVYMRLLTVQWLRKARLPNDISELAAETDINPKQMRKCLAELIAKGKITDDGETIGNPRMDRDIEAIMARSQVAKKREAVKRETKKIVDQSAINPRSIANVSTIDRECIDDQSSIVEAESQENQRLKKQTATTAPLYIEIEIEKEIEEEPPTPSKGDARASTNWNMEALKAFQAWNDTALRCALPQAAKLTGDRTRRIVARLKDYGLDGWMQALANVEKSSFLTGGTDAGFRADLDFICQAKSFGKLHDGGYGNGRHTAESAATAKEAETAKIFERCCEIYKGTPNWTEAVGIPRPGTPEAERYRHIFQRYGYAAEAHK